MRWMKPTLAIFGVIVVALLVWASSGLLIVDGWAPVLVTITSSDPRPIKAAVCVTCGASSEASPVLGMLRRQKRERWGLDPLAGVADPFCGVPLRVTVPFSTHSSGWGLWRRHSQHRALAVLVEYEGGGWAEAVAEIPGPPIPETLTVHIP